MSGETSSEAKPGAGLVGAACAAAQPLVPVPAQRDNASAMQFFAPDPNDERGSVRLFVLLYLFVIVSSSCVYVGCVNLSSS